jgi:hypothetical protein
MVTQAFLEHGRPYPAIEILALWADQSEPSVPALLIARALEEAGTTPPPENEDVPMFSYHGAGLQSRGRPREASRGPLRRPRRQPDT